VHSCFDLKKCLKSSSEKWRDISFSTKRRSAEIHSFSDNDSSWSKSSTKEPSINLENETLSAKGSRDFARFGLVKNGVDRAWRECFLLQ